MMKYKGFVDALKGITAGVGVLIIAALFIWLLTSDTRLDLTFAESFIIVLIGRILKVASDCTDIAYAHFDKR